MGFKKWIKIFKSSAPKEIVGGLTLEAVATVGSIQVDPSPQMVPGAGNDRVVVIDE